MSIVHEWPKKEQNLETENGSPINKPSSKGYSMTDTERSTSKIGSLLLVRWLTTSTKFPYLVSDFITTLLKESSGSPKHLEVKVHMPWFNRSPLLSSLFLPLVLISHSTLACPINIHIFSLSTLSMSLNFSFIQNAGTPFLPSLIGNPYSSILCDSFLFCPALTH